MDLLKMRRSIDRLDSEFVQLLNRRMETAVRTKRFKSEITDASREEEVLSRVRGFARGLVTSEFAESLTKLILAESRRLQSLDLPLIAFHGEHGAYSEVAVGAYDPKMIGIPCRELSEVLEGVEGGGVDFGILPIENSVEGSVDFTQDVLVDTRLFIVGEVRVPVRHALLTLKETDYRDIKDVYAHPEALSQCHGFLRRNKLDGRPWYDSAGAALMLVRERPTAAAVIASALCAQLYDLEVLKEGIEDYPASSTRYVILSKEQAKVAGDKCSIVFFTEHRAGALFETLKVFSDAGINLTRIESRPSKKDPSKVAFVVDFLGSERDAKVEAALEKLRKVAQYRLLGCYPQFVQQG